MVEILLEIFWGLVYGLVYVQYVNPIEMNLQLLTQAE